MKNSFSLIEVIISIVILSVVMISLIQIKSNNVFLLDKLKSESNYLNYILISIDLEQMDHSFYLSEKINFYNDEIRKDLKEIKINFYNDDIINDKFKIGNKSIDLKIFKKSYEIENKIKKNIHSFEVKL